MREGGRNGSGLTVGPLFSGVPVVGSCLSAVVI